MKEDNKMQRNTKKPKLKKYVVVPVVVGIVCVIAIIVGIVLGMPEKVDAARVSKQIDLGNKYLAAADYDNAKVTFNKALKIDPKSVEAASGMATVYNKKNQPEKAVKYLKKASDNLTSSSQAESLQKVYQETKEQMANSSGTTNNSGISYENESSLKKIENTITIYLNEATPTPETEEPLPDDAIPDSTEESLPNDSGEDDDISDITDEDSSAVNSGEPYEELDLTDEFFEQDIEISTDDFDGSEDQVTSTIPESEDEIPVEIDNTTGMNYDSEYDETFQIDYNTDTAENDIAITTQEISVDETPIETADVNYEDILNNYINNTLPMEIPSAGFRNTTIPYTYSNGEIVNASMNGRLSEKQQDLDADGVPELIVTEMQHGAMVFRIYKINNGMIKQTASQVASMGMKNAIESVSYGNTQVCFLVNNNGMYEIGFATYCFGYDSGDGTPSTQTNVEVYSIAADGNISLCASGSVEDGEGQDSFASDLNPAGLNGSWNSSNAEALQSIGYAEDPYQDITGILNPLENGLASVESGVEDLVIINTEMSMGSAMLTVK